MPEGSGMPRVSVVVPNYNHARYLRQRIESVLGQTYQDFELILLDDCSTDESQAILTEYASERRVRLQFNEKNSGSTFKQWNKGVRLARGKYVWIAESDDYADRRFLGRLVRLLDERREVTFAYCRSWRILDNGERDGFVDPELPKNIVSRWSADYYADGYAECRDYMIQCNTVPNASAVAFRKAAYERIGGADENLRVCGDWKLWAGLALRGKVAYVAEGLNSYRFYDTTVRNKSKKEGIWTKEGAQVCWWIHDQTELRSQWVPLVMSTHVSLREKRDILRRALQVDPHPIRNALGPALHTVQLKLLRHWRQLISVIRAVRNEPEVRRVIVRSKMPGSTPKDWFSGIDDETWFWMNTTGRRRRKATARLVAGMPKVSMQEQYTGSSGDQTLGEGFHAYGLFKKCYETHVGPIGSCRGVLDFGCGWGRIIRFFLKDVAPEKLFGVDHSEEAVRACQETNKWCKFKLIGPHPPTPLSAEAFDLIYLYSVFSHLPEEMHWGLLREFHRLLAPGGMLIATTRARDFIYFCRSLRQDPRLNEKPEWLRGSAVAFEDADAAISEYDNGQFCYASLRVGDPRWSFWGEACIPRGYVERRWKEIFDICDYIDNREVCPQNVIVARKRVPISVGVRAPAIVGTGTQMKASTPENV